MNESHKREFLKERGWYPWYNDNYLVNEKMGGNGLDHTYRGLSVEDAFLYETSEEHRKKTDDGMEMGESMLKAFSNLKEIMAK